MKSKNRIFFPSVRAALIALAASAMFACSDDDEGFADLAVDSPSLEIQAGQTGLVRILAGSRRICLYGKRPADRRRAACGADDLSPGTCLGEYLLCRGGYPDRTVGVGRRDRVSGAVGTVLYGRGAVVRRRAAEGAGFADGKRIWSKESREPAFIA